ncbi:P-loop containing nucleoside triphosphate hydrolase protein [Hypoxylon sp. FL1150]|nr:P-loop containing nucleoside triphosphate hydrolase protein [Hypoxylon sp. FL1150]
MSSLEPRRRSRARFEEENDQPTSGSDSPKRQKRITNGALVEEDEDDENGRSVSRNMRIKTSPSRDGPGNTITDFQPGAIVRVLVENFVTYEHAEFHPGPNLNMVIGPNGTGKSSLVCAICLGLGYHPRHLGRAQSMGEFVKHGKDFAIVEVELQGRPNDQDNYVVRLQIRKEDNKCKYWLNGKDSTHSAIKKLVNALHIQIDNLCQFLPQDRVVEFAGLTPVQLLQETLRAAAPERITEYHESLRKLHLDHKRIKGKLDENAEILKNHETRQQGSQADVDRLRDREAIQKHIDNLKSAHVIAEYTTVRNAYSDAKQKSRDATKKLRELEAACEPALQAVNRKKEYQRKIGVVVEERKVALKRAEAACGQLVEAIEAQDEEIKQLQNKKSAEQGSYDSRRVDIHKGQRAIRDLEAKLQNKPPEFVPADYNMKIRQQQAIVRENVAKRRELDSKRNEEKAAYTEKNNEKRRLEKELENLNSQEGQKLSQLRKINGGDIAKGWEWLQEHKGEFEEEVFGPPMLNCSITDQRYSDQIQSLLAQEDFLCFTCQTPNDHKKLSAQFYKVLGISVSIRTCRSDFASFQPGIPKEQIREMGLDAYAIEFLEGPAPVLAMLCSEKRLHTCAVALRDISNDQYERVAGCERIPSWSSGRTLYRVQRRREYGGNAVSTSTRKIMSGRFWTNQPVDQSEKTMLQMRISEADEALGKIKEEILKLGEELAQIVDGPINAEIDRLMAEKNELQKAATYYATLGERIATEKANLETKQKAIMDSRKRMQEYGEREDRLVIKKAKSILEHNAQLSQIRDAHQALLEAQIRFIEAQSDVKRLEQQNSDVNRQIDEKKAELDTLKREQDTLRAEATVVLERVQALQAGDNSGDDPDSGYSLWAEIAKNRTPEDIAEEVDAETNRLRLIEGVNPEILRQYEKRAQLIQEFTKKKENLSDQLDEIAGNMAHIMERWEPAVDEVIGKINDAFAYNFEQINCAGEVGLRKDEDFEQWAVVIKVKFRESETLQPLNQHRQSGGERAVSTIFYLMALQSMAQAPFRVVDEINQGMDPRNERMVHERMVEIACREHTSQYFLITPKLLTGLRYDERMRILCIASGEHMPSLGDATRGLDFGNLVRIQRAIASAA